MGLEEGKFKKLVKAAPLVAVAMIAQPPTQPDQETLKPAGVRDSIEKLRRSEDKKILLPDGRQVQIVDNTPPKKKETPEPTEH